MRTACRLAALLCLAACVGNIGERAGRLSDDELRSALAHWVSVQLGWEDTRIELVQANEPGQASCWHSVVHRIPETSGGHVMLVLDASGKVVSASLGR